MVHANCPPRSGHSPDDHASSNLLRGREEESVQVRLEPSTGVAHRFRPVFKVRRLLSQNINTLRMVYSFQRGHFTNLLPLHGRKEQVRRSSTPFRTPSRGNHQHGRHGHVCDDRFGLLGPDELHTDDSGQLLYTGVRTNFGTARQVDPSLRSFQDHGHYAQRRSGCNSERVALPIDHVDIDLESPHVRYWALVHG